MSDRHPIVAGRFYPGTERALRREVQEYLGNADGTVEPLMVMLPHAGYMFCGSIIGATLGRVRLPERLILLGPNHSGRGRPLAVWPEGKWITPLGPVEVDAGLADRCIASGGGFEADMEAHASEHSLEVPLPFLQAKVPALSIVPICVGLHDLEGLRRAGEALAGVLREETRAGRTTALVVSSDMNHFENQERTVQKDTQALSPLLERTPEKLFATVRAERITMCGVCPAALALFACNALGATKAELAGYGTSATASGDSGRVVGYAGAYVW